MQLDRLIHAVEYLGFSRIKMNYDLLDRLSSDCLRIKRKNRYEGLYIAYYMTNFRLFAKQVLNSFGCRRFIFPEEQPTFQIFVKLVHSEVKRSRLGFFQVLLNASKRIEHIQKFAHTCEEGTLHTLYMNDLYH